MVDVGNLNVIEWLEVVLTDFDTVSVNCSSFFDIVELYKSPFLKKYREFNYLDWIRFDWQFGFNLSPFTSSKLGSCG